jgi:hypothetical protein
MALSKDLKEFVECLNSNKVEYLIVGALAVSWHGFARFSSDLDFFIRPAGDNAQRVLNALRDFGFAGLGVTLEDLTAPDRVIQIGREPNRVDLLTSISGVEFEEAWDSRVSGVLDRIPVNFIGFDALLKNKGASGRAKDRIDVEALRAAKRLDTGNP